MVTHHSMTCHCEERSLRRSNLLLILIFFIFGCKPASPSPTPVSVAEATPTLKPLFTETQTVAPNQAARLRNAQYQLGVTSAIRTVQFMDGKFEQGAPGGTDYISVIVTDFVAVGDLNGDGEQDEVAALIAENYGGAGVFTFLALYEDVNGTLTFINSAYVDDRPVSNALSIENGEIFLDVLIHKSDDPLCCPTFRIMRHYRLALNNQLRAADYSTFTPDGKPRTITIDTPASGTQISGSIQIRGSVAITPFENNLIYRIFDIGGVELASGPVTVNAMELGGPGTFDTIIALSNILSGAVIRIEIQDLSAEDGALLAMDSVELVVK